jgi:hypothetical protein
VAAALTTSTPSGRSTRSTSARARRPCSRRIAGGIVTCPVRVIFTVIMSPRKDRIVNLLCAPYAAPGLLRSRAFSNHLSSTRPTNQSLVRFQALLFVQASRRRVKEYP